ncbi:MAG TPA: potassium channel family protein, partial [Geminicoccaceae bacterium]|nr:potassium channel family protein [Geminicoccaceae bacterium]
GDGLWLTLTTVVTVGYGDYSAETVLGRTATIILIYFGGIFVMFHVAADYFEYRLETKQAMLKGRWKWDMKNHILLLNSPTINPARYFERLVAEIRESREFCDASVVLVTRDFPNGLPDELKDLGVVHRHGYAGDPKNLNAADAAHAAVVIVLAEQADDKRSDGITFDVLHRLREMGCRARVVAECVADANRDRLRAAGAEIVTRPIRFYPEIMVRAMTSPGAEIILENLFVADDDECVGFKVQVDGRRWADLVMDFMERDVGTAIAYTGHDGTIHTNPGPNERVHARTIYVIVKQGKRVPEAEVQRLCTVPQRPTAGLSSAPSDS